MRIPELDCTELGSLTRVRSTQLRLVSPYRHEIVGGLLRLKFRAVKPQTLWHDAPRRESRRGASRHTRCCHNNKSGLKDLGPVEKTSDARSPMVNEVARGALCDSILQAGPLTGDPDCPVCQHRFRLRRSRSLWIEARETSATEKSGFAANQSGADTPHSKLLRLRLAGVFGCQFCASYAQL